MNWDLFKGYLCQNTRNGMIFTLVEPYQKYDSKMLRDDFGDSYPQEFCKPICNDLKLMTKEEKEEMQKTFFNEHGIICQIYLNSDYCVVMEKKGSFEKYYLNVREILWLMERKFFVGQCKESECIIMGK